MLNIENFVCPAFGALQKGGPYRRVGPTEGWAQQKGGPYRRVGGPTLEFLDVSTFNKSCLTLLGPKIRFPEM